MDRIAQDVRFALRSFRRASGFFATAVVILAIGIGMSVAMFTMFRTVLVRRSKHLNQSIRFIGSLRAANGGRTRTDPVSIALVVEQSAAPLKQHRLKCA